MKQLNKLIFLLLNTCAFMSCNSGKNHTVLEIFPESLQLSRKECGICDDSLAVVEGLVCDISIRVIAILFLMEKTEIT